MQKPILLLYLTMLILSSCQKTEHAPIIQNLNTAPGISAVDSASSIKKTIFQKKDTTYLSKYLAVDNFLVNGLKMIMTRNEFTANIKKTDSSSTDLCECGSPFEWLDKEWMIKTYGPEDEYAGTFKNFDSKITTLYFNDVEYNTNDHLYLFDQAETKNNKFTFKSHHLNLDKNTTVAKF